MQPSLVDARCKALFLTPESPASPGGGGLRSASLLTYLRAKYDVDTVGVNLPSHSGTVTARVSRNVVRLVRGRPPLFDRYSGHQLVCDGKAYQPRGYYRVAVVEHFWCASYVDILRPHAERLVLDLHNVESALARSCARGVAKHAFLRFARAYQRLEREYLPRFDLVLVASEEDRARVEILIDGRRQAGRPPLVVYPNALCPAATVCGNRESSEQHAIIFSGNLAYHPNVEAVRWFHRYVWPRLRKEDPLLEWRLVGVNPRAIQRIVEGDGRVQVVGPVDNALARLAEAKLAIVPLLSGSGTRFKILEAWAACRAVVSTTRGAEGLAAKPGEHLFIADGAEAFAKAILKALTSPELRRQLGENGHTLCQSRYTWPKAWQALEEAGL